MSRGLCGTCREAHIRVDDAGKEVVSCHAFADQPQPIVRPVSQCNQHRDINHITEWEANKIGWILEVKGQRVIGFKSPDKEDK